MSIEMDWLMRLRVTEVISDTFTDTQLDTLRKDGAGTERALDSGTTPDVEDYAIFSKSLSTGTATIDLTSLAHVQGSATITKSATGKKVRAWAFWTPSGNTANITVTKGASNGYSPLGTSFTYVIGPNGEAGAYFHDDAGDVGSGAKNLDISGTGTESVYVAVAWG